MPLKITQENINGFISNYNQLSLLIKDNSPDIIYLQGSLLPNNSKSFALGQGLFSLFL